MSEEHNLIPFIDHQLTRLAGNPDYSQMFQALTVARETIIKAAPNDQWLGSVIPHDMTVAELRTQLANTEKKLREMIDAEHRLSDAYIRIRELVGTINMTGPVWKNTEEAVKKLVEQAAVASKPLDIKFEVKSQKIESEEKHDPTGASPHCMHKWIPSEGRTTSGFLCNKCGAYDVPEPDQPHPRFPLYTNFEFAHLQANGKLPDGKPCVLCGVFSSHPEGYHYCKKAAE